MKYVYKKRNRLTKPRELECVIKAKKKKTTKHFVIYFRENDLGYSRLGMIIKKNTVPKAVDRNRIKRFIKEIFRINQDKFKTWVDIVIIIYRDYAYETPQNIEEELKLAWHEVGII